MTGNEVIALVRANYGDAANNFLGTTDLQSWLNQALQEVYTFLPSGDMREVVQQSAIALTSGRGDIPSTWDRVVSIFTAALGEAINMPSHVINAQRSLSDFFIPDAFGFSIDGNEILVTPDTVTSVTAQYLVQPTKITNFASEIAGIPTRYHPMLVDWTTSLAYASEEDVQQASFYADRARAAVQSRFQQGGPS